MNGEQSSVMATLVSCVSRVGHLAGGLACREGCRVCAKSRPEKCPSTVGCAGGFLFPISGLLLIEVVYSD